MKLTTIGPDLAKNVIQVRGADNRGRAGAEGAAQTRPVPFFANLVSCKIGMEACSSVHYTGHGNRMIRPPTTG